ncbi:hypothetical protein L2E82_50309 [Cichorium intybus]|nr:hypothetical protein L2E82_50309 [Cichorium intybus]
MSTGTFSSHPASSFIHSLADLYLQTTDDEIEGEEEKSAKSGRNFNRQWTGRGRVLNQGEISIESGLEEGILQLDMWGLTPSEVENLPDFQMNNNDAGFGTMNYRNQQMQFSQQQFPAM